MAAPSAGNGEGNGPGKALKLGTETGAEDEEVWWGRVRMQAGDGHADTTRRPGDDNGGSGRLTSGAIVAVVHVVESHPCPTSPPQTARVGIAYAERAKDVGSLVAEDFAT